MLRVTNGSIFYEEKPTMACKKETFEKTVLSVYLLSLLAGGGTLGYELSDENVGPGAGVILGVLGAAFTGLASALAWVSCVRDTACHRWLNRFAGLFYSSEEDVRLLHTTNSNDASAAIA